MPEENLALKTTNLGKTYNRNFRQSPLCALSDVSLEVACGTVLGIVGPNRAGKSTLMHLCLGLLKPTTGSVRILGKNLAEVDRPGDISAILQSVSIPGYLTARTALFFLGTIALRQEEPLSKELDCALAKVKLGDRKDDPLRSFSRGMLQRLQMAQAMVANPKLLFLDEPSESLDLDGKCILSTWIKERKAAGQTTILASHDMDLLASACDKITLMHQGRLSEPKNLSAWTDNGSLHLEQAVQRQLQLSLGESSI